MIPKPLRRLQCKTSRESLPFPLSILSMHATPGIRDQTRYLVRGSLLVRLYFACIDTVTLGSPLALLFYPMLFSSAGVPGGKNENYTKLIPSVSDYIWLTNNRRNWRDSCSGWNVHNICIVSSGDLHRLAFDSRKPVFFHNKFFMERDRTVMDCAENVLLIRNREEYRRDILVK